MVNDATTTAITVVNLARCMISSICGYYKRPRLVARHWPGVRWRPVRWRRLVGPPRARSGGLGQRRADRCRRQPKAVRRRDQRTERRIRSAAPVVLALAVKRTQKQDGGRPGRRRPRRSDVAPIVMGARARTLALRGPDAVAPATAETDAHSSVTPMNGASARLRRLS